jgi:hypothetical protein
MGPRTKSKAESKRASVMRILEVHVYLIVSYDTEECNGK